MIYTDITLYKGDNLRIDCGWFNEDSDNTITFTDPNGNIIGLEQPDPVTTICEFVTEFYLEVRPAFDFQRKQIALDKLICSTGEECMSSVLTTNN